MCRSASVGDCVDGVVGVAMQELFAAACTYRTQVELMHVTERELVEDEGDEGDEEGDEEGEEEKASL